MNAPYKLNRPKDLADYCIRIADQAYIIYNEETAYCTRCGKFFKVESWYDPVHNTKSYCPECGANIIFKNERYGRKTITEFGRILWMQKRKSITYLQLDEYIIDYNQGMVPVVHFWPSAQYKFSAKEQHYYKHTPESRWCSDRWDERKRIKLPSAAHGMFCSMKVPTYQKTNTYLLTANRTGTDLKYANVCRHLDPYQLIQYIHLFLKYQSIELLEKAGYEEIVKDKLKERTSKEINWRGKELKKILKCSPKELKDIKRMNFNIRQLESYRKNKKIFPWMRIEESETINRIINRRTENLEKAGYQKKTIIYLLEQRKEYRNTVNINDYDDYIRECEQLGYDVHRKEIKYPKNLREAHQETSQKIKVELDAHMEEYFRKTQHDITQMTEPFIFGKYLIRPAENPQELMKESEILKHCVRTYVNQVARGKTSILFIRDIKNPDKPLFTLELSPKKTIVQCRGKYNCDYPEDVAEFIEEWEIQVLKTKKRNKKGVAA